jgi:hypothetical protein
MAQRVHRLLLALSPLSLLFFGWIVGSCEREKVMQKEILATSVNEDLEIKTRFLVTDKKISIDYKAHCLSGHGLLLYDALWKSEANGVPKYYPKIAFISFVASTLRVERVFPPIPEKKNVEVAYVPWVRIVSPGETINGVVVVDLPAVEFSPYYVSHPKYKNVESKKLELILGFAPLDGAELEPISREMNLWSILRGSKGGGEITVAVDLPWSVAVKERQDLFERF